MLSTRRAAIEDRRARPIELDRARQESDHLLALSADADAGYGFIDPAPVDLETEIVDEDGLDEVRRADALFIGDRVDEVKHAWVDDEGHFAPAAHPGEGTSEPAQKTNGHAFAVVAFGSVESDGSVSLARPVEIEIALPTSVQE